MVGRLELALALALIALALGCDRDEEKGEESAPEEIFGKASGEGASGPDVIVITVDTLRADRLGAYGYEEANTPALDRLIGSGTRFDRATVPMPRTTPALASLMTGLWPHHHGSREVWMRFETEETLARVLQRRGYQTIGLSANASAQKRQGFARGFDVFKNRNGKPASRLTNDAVELAAKAHAERPIFLWVHYLDPHWPYAAPADAKEGSVCAELEANIKDRKFTSGQLHVDAFGRASSALEDCSERYDREVAYVDTNIGRLLEHLRKLERFEDALVVFAADHGESLGEDDLYYEHGPSLHGASMRIPMAVRLPGQTEGRVDGRVARIEDLMPTLLRLLEVPREDWPEMDGRDLSPRLRGEPAEEGGDLLAFAESAGAMAHHETGFLVSGRRGGKYCLNQGRYSYCREDGEVVGLFDHEQDPGLKRDLSDEHPKVAARFRRAVSRWKPETARSLAVRGERFKLVARPKLSGGHRRVLYDLQKDPDETRDASDDHPEEKKRLAAELERWADDLPSFQPPQRTESSIEQLRALGYVE